MQFKDYFSKKAAGYAAHRPIYPELLASYLADLAPSRQLAWDCGCGSGQLSIILAEKFGHVVATDASAKQITQAISHAKVDYRCMPANSSGLPDSSVDLVTAAQSVHWFDLPSFYQEVRRVGRPGAVIALICYGLMSIDPAIDTLIQHFYKAVLGPYWPPERAHVENKYRSLDFPFQEIAAPALEMKTRWNFFETIGYMNTWSAVTEAERAAGLQMKEDFFARLAEAWGATETKRLVRWPLSMRVGII